MTYEDLIAAKARAPTFPGIPDAEISPALFPHQRDLVRWSLRKGRAAIFADTGLGKTAMELEWAKHVAQHSGGRVLILAPLAVAQQIGDEAKRFGVEATVTREDTGARITVANYEMLHRFDTADFAGVVLDESSILKAYDGKTRTALVESFRNTPFRLAATATPAPNDHTELGNHAEFLGVKTRTEMLAEYFVHDSGDTSEWRLKGHAQESFWRWMASWGAVVRSPADLGHDDSAYRLPPLRMHHSVFSLDHATAQRAGMLFAGSAMTLAEQRAVRRATQHQRVERAVEVARGGDGPSLIWCELNEEQDRIADALGDLAFSVQGADDPDTKIDRILRWQAGERPVMVSKTSVIGFGLNFQHCARMAFVGASHSYEQTYQAIRRCWRFGQTRPVDVTIIRADVEQAIVDNYERKHAEAERLAVEMSAHIKDIVRAEIGTASAREWNSYSPAAPMALPSWIGGSA